jgi:hypothetical protein
MAQAPEPEPLTEREAEGLRLLMELLEKLKQVAPEGQEDED